MEIIESYGSVVFILSLVIGIGTLPLGLAIPLYFHIKAKNGEAHEHTKLEIGAILFTGVIAIPLVELFGRKGAIIAIMIPIFIIGIFGLFLAGAVV